jgi:DNA repair exonuclease SbcCD nuclease subunit
MNQAADSIPSTPLARPTRPLRLLHTSDVHLETDTFGAGPSGEQLRARVRKAFSDVITIANQRRSDLLLIVGDLFDSSRVSNLALAFAFDQIGIARMPVLLIPGNHDAHDERSIYAALAPGSLPPNLHLILDPAGRVIDFPNLQTRVWGRALVEHSPEYRPLSGIPEPADGCWNIAMAHGYFTDDLEFPRSSKITRDEIESSGYDYIALGHVHLYGDVSQGATRALYCGTPAPLYAGDEAGFVAEVSCLPDGGVSVERVAVQS